MPLQLGSLNISSIRLVGQHHLEHGKPCQDYLSVYRDESLIVVAVCDGVGGVPYSHLGSELHAKESVTTVRELIHEKRPQLTSVEFLSELYQRFYKRIRAVTEELKIHPLDAVETFLPSTTELLIITPEECAVLSLGDGYLRWQRSLKSTAERTQRYEPPGVILPPPLLTTALLADSGDTSDLERPHGEELRREAEAFAIVAYGRSEDVFATPVEIATDGLRFTDEFISTTGTYEGFPLDDLRRRQSPPEIYDAALMYNLATYLPDRRRTPAQVLRVCRGVLGDTKLGPDIGATLRQATRNAVLRHTEEVRRREPQLDAAMQGGTPRQLLDLIISPVSQLETAISPARSDIEEDIIDAATRILRDKFRISISPFHSPLWDDLTSVYLSKQ